MTISQTPKELQFVVGPDGQPTAVLIAIAAWQRVVDLLEDGEDQGLLRTSLTRRRTAPGLTKPSERAVWCTKVNEPLRCSQLMWRAHRESL